MKVASSPIVTSLTSVTPSASSRRLKIWDLMWSVPRTSPHRTRGISSPSLLKLTLLLRKKSAPSRFSLLRTGFCRVERLKILVRPHSGLSTCLGRVKTQYIRHLRGSQDDRVHLFFGMHCNLFSKDALCTFFFSFFRSPVSFFHFFFFCQTESVSK